MSTSCMSRRVVHVFTNIQTSEKNTDGINDTKLKVVIEDVIVPACEMQCCLQGVRRGLVVTTPGSQTLVLV